MRMQRIKLENVVNIQWKNYSVVAMRHSFGRRYRFVIQSMSDIIINGLPYLEYRINAKNQIDENKNMILIGSRSFSVEIQT